MDDDLDVVLEGPETSRFGNHLDITKKDWFAGGHLFPQVGGWERHVRLVKRWFSA